MLLIVPVLATQLTAFVARLPSYVVQLQALATEQNREWLQRVLGDRLPDVSRSVAELVTQSTGWIASFVQQSLWAGGATFIYLFGLAVITPVVAFYLLKDWTRMMDKVDSWLPLPHKETILGLMREMNIAMAGFVRGQATVCLVLMIYYGMALSGAGLNFGLLIGLGTGFLSFIPYVGSITGLMFARASPSSSSGRTGPWSSSSSPFSASASSSSPTCSIRTSWVNRSACIRSG